MALIEMSLLIEAASFACKGYLKWLAMEDIAHRREEFIVDEPKSYLG